MRVGEKRWISRIEEAILDFLDRGLGSYIYLTFLELRVRCRTFGYRVSRLFLV
jgi:hypothetical protein